VALGKKPLINVEDGENAVQALQRKEIMGAGTIVHQVLLNWNK